MPRIKRIVATGVAIVTISMPALASAATKTWDAGGSDQLWSTAANWDSDTRPGTGDTILFNGTGQKNAIISTDAFKYPIGELRMTASNTGTLTIAKPITVGNVYLSGGTLTVQGGSRITARKSWFNGGGTFTAGTGSVVFSGSGTTYTLKETNSFYDVFIDDGLVGYWRLDSSSSGYTPDSSRNAFQGLMSSGATISTDVATVDFVNEGSLSLDGVNDSVDAGNVLNFERTDPFTIALWVKINAEDNFYSVVGKQQGTPAYTGYNLWIRSDNTAALELTSNLATNNYLMRHSAATFSAGEWQHLAVTYNGSSSASGVNFYVDGVLSNGVTVRNSLSSSIVTIRQLHLGSRFDNGGASGQYYLNGSLDDVRIYNRVLAASEIAQLYNGSQNTGSGKYTLGAAVTARDDFGVYSGILDVSGSDYGITASGSFVNNSRFIPRSGTVTLNGIATDLILYGTELYNLTIASVKSAILRMAATVTNALSIAASGTLHLNGFDFTAADITNAGTLTEGTGAVLHDGSLTSSRTSDVLGADITFTLTDGDENIDGTSLDTVSLPISVNGSAQETLTLTETAVASGIFTATIGSRHGTVAASNSIIESEGDCSVSIDATFEDAQDSTDEQAHSVALSDASMTGCVSGSSGGGGGSGGGRGAPSPSTPPASGTSGPGSSTDNESEAPSSFSDVRIVDWFFEPIMSLVKKGIVSGYKDASGNVTGNFGPADPVTVGQILKIVLLASDREIDGSAKPKNATANDWSAPYVAAAETLGWTLSSQDSKRPATRSEVIAAILEAFDVDIDASAPNPFTDVQSSHPNADAIATALQLELVTGDTDMNGNPRYTFRPNDPINRAETAAMIMRMLNIR